MWKFFVEAEPSAPSEIEESLWTSGRELSANDLQIAFEQYKLYVELADRVSARRAVANTFFLTLNTAVFTAIGLLWSDPPDATPWLGLFPLITLVGQCIVWYSILRSYRQLNSAKWAVVGALEIRLPASPWSSAEWNALGEGKDHQKYLPLTYIEHWIPWLFAVAYVGGFIVLAVS